MVNNIQKSPDLHNILPCTFGNSSNIFAAALLMLLLVLVDRCRLCPGEVLRVGLNSNECEAFGANESALDELYKGSSSSEYSFDNKGVWLWMGSVVNSSATTPCSIEWMISEGGSGMGRTKKKPRIIGSDVPRARRRRKYEVFPPKRACPTAEKKNAERPKPDNTKLVVVDRCRVQL
jgi:hypothetical protein